MIIKVFFTVVLSIGFISGFSQNALQNDIIIEGKVSKEEVKDSDTIYFTNGMLGSQFYETPTIFTAVNDNRFKLKASLSYPQLFTVSFESERQKIRFRGGDYFIDASTNYVEVSELRLAGCNYVEGDTFKEYKSTFIPFFTPDNESCHSATIQSLSFKNGVEFDEKLLSYTLLNPDSYVALWALITRIHFQGHTPHYETILNSFSDKIKTEALWNIVYNDLGSIRVKKKAKSFRNSI